MRIVARPFAFWGPYSCSYSESLPLFWHCILVHIAVIMAPPDGTRHTSAGCSRVFCSISRPVQLTGRDLLIRFIASLICCSASPLHAGASLMLILQACHLIATMSAGPSLGKWRESDDIRESIKLRADTMYRCHDFAFFFLPRWVLSRMDNNILPLHVPVAIMHGHHCWCNIS